MNKDVLTYQKIFESENGTIKVWAKTTNMSLSISEKDRDKIKQDALDGIAEQVGMINLSGEQIMEFPISSDDPEKDEEWVPVEFSWEF